MRPFFRLIALLWVCFATPAGAQTPSRVAITSLVGDTMTVSTQREPVGTNIIRNQVQVVPMPGPEFDIAVVQAAEAALRRALPRSEVAMLRVPAAGTSADPVQFFSDGLVDAKNPTLLALRQQGFTHVVAAIRLRANNRVKLTDQSIGAGQLEGLGFYLDRRIRVRYENEAATFQGIIAPHVYIQLVLIDLQAMEIRGIQKITASGTTAARSEQSNGDPWNALTPERKVAYIEALIREEVADAAPKLFPSR